MTGWMARAACAECDPEWWFDPDPRAAVQVCLACPARAACAAFALGRPALEGVWGGLTVEERDARRGCRGSYRAGCRCVRCVDVYRSYSREWVAAKRRRRAEVAS